MEDPDVVTRELPPGRWVSVRLSPDDDVLLQLRAAVEAYSIDTAVIVNGVGSLKRYRVHVVGAAVLPTFDEFITGEGPFDILNVTGFVIGGRVHAHITFADTQRAMGGHLEEGCKVLTFAALTLMETPGASLSGWDTVGDPGGSRVPGAGGDA